MISVKENRHATSDIHSCRMTTDRVGLNVFLGSSETEIFDLMSEDWDAPGSTRKPWTVRNVQSALRVRGKVLSVSGIQVTMNRMYAKGFLRRVEKGHSGSSLRYFYSPLMSRLELEFVMVRLTLECLLREFPDHVEEYLASRA